MSTCTCTDPEVDELRDLIAAGIDQRTASLLLWGEGTPLGNAAAVRVAGARARRTVRAGFAAAFPWLRLPPAPGSEVS